MKATVIDIKRNYVIVRHDVGINGIYLSEEKAAKLKIGDVVNVYLNPET